MMKKIAILTSSFGEYDKVPLTALKSAGLNVVLNPYGRKAVPSEVLSLCSDAVGIISGTEQLDENILTNLKDLRVVSRCGVGLDNIDLDAASRLKIKIFSTPDGPTLSVAELTIGLILNLLRKINSMDRNLRNGKWEKLMGSLLASKKVGIIGFGRIGMKTGELLKMLGSDVYFTDPNIESGILGFKKLPLSELLSQCDIISIHAAIKDRIVGKTEIDRMKKGSLLVNVARGSAVDEEALFDAIKDGRLAGAALDVFVVEPYKGRLAKLDNVILTPHIGSYAKEARIKMEMDSVNNLIKGLSDI